MRDIKKEYKKYVVIYFLTYLLVNIIILLKLNPNNIKNIFTNEYFIKTISMSIASPIISILALIILNIIPDRIKNVLIFWKFKHVLPSYRWQDIIKYDDRINCKNDQKKLSNEEQHAIWYKNYKENKDNLIILNSQKDYLFARDLCISTCILLIIVILCYLIFKESLDISFKFLSYNIFILFVLYLILMLVARNSANKFVCNVVIDFEKKDK